MGLSQKEEGGGEGNWPGSLQVSAWEIPQSGGGGGCWAETVAGPEAPLSTLPLAALFPRRLSLLQPLSKLWNGEQGDVWGGVQKYRVGNLLETKALNLEKGNVAWLLSPSLLVHSRRRKAGQGGGDGGVQCDVSTELQRVTE